MAIELITGYAGSGHISAADWGRLNAGLCGQSRYVLNTGTRFAYSVASNNLITIGSGDAVDQGRHISIPQGSTENLTISNGTSGRKRVDVIALRYSKDGTTGIETASTVVIKGTEVDLGSIAPIPAVTSGDIFAGALVDEMPLYQVRISGIQIESVVPVYTVIPSLSQVFDQVYPVGSIYLSVTGVDPGELFGGEWEEIQDRFLLGRSQSIAAGVTGGSKTVTLSVENLPAHRHTGPAHTHTISGHTHTASCASNGAHKHAVDRAKLAATGTAKYAAQSGTGNPTHNTESAGAHTHTITIANGGGGSTGSAGTGNTGSTGSGTAVNIMPPYVAVYMWKRIQ